MQTTHVLVSDPSGQLPDGYVFKTPRALQLSEARGCIALPVDDDLVPGATMNPLDGFVIRSWGEGWPFDKGSGERGCPMVLRVLPGRQFVHWAAYVAPLVAAAVKGSPARQRAMSGKLRLITDTSNPVYASGGLSAIESPDLFELGADVAPGGRVIRGLSRTNVIEPCLMALNLHGVARGCRVMWSAVSLASTPR